MKETSKLPSLALALTLLSASSALALERAGQQIAQDDRGGPPPREKGEGAPRGNEGGGGGGERPSAPPQGKPDEGGAPEKPARQHEKPAAREEAPPAKAAPAHEPGEAPPAHKRDEGSAPRREPAPAAKDEEAAPPKKPQRPKEDAVEPSQKAEPRAEPKAPPKPKVEPSPEPKEEVAPKQPPKREPKAAPVEPKAAPTEPKAAPIEPKEVQPKPVPKSDTKEPEVPKHIEPKAGEPGHAPDGKAKPEHEATPSGEPKMPAPAEKAPGVETPKGTPPEGGPLPKRDGKAPEGAPRQNGAGAPGAPGAPGTVAPSEVKDLKELKQERKEHTEDGGKRVIIEEPDKRAIVKEGGQTIIRHDETERFRRLGGGSTRNEKRNGLDISINIRPGGIEIFTETDDRGRTLRRYRRDREGRDVILYDNRDYYRRHSDGNFVDAIVDLPPPRVSIPRNDYIVDYEEASDVEVYEALAAPPVERLDRVYSMEEVRRSPALRDRMRRIDLDAINFEFGAWDVTRDQYPALQRVADAMRRVIDRNPDEMFLIEGHTDAVGSDEDNLSLSDRRAESVSIVLTEQFGVPPENMTTQGYGEQYLKVNTQQAERQNRRVAVRRITPLLSRN